jgi:hypothetical protein
VLVAIDDYGRAGNGIGPDLRAAVNDAKAMARVLEDVCGFGKVTLLANEQANNTEMMRVFSEIARALERDPGPARLWFQLAGHGLAAADNETQATLFATWETSKDQPSVSGLPAETIRRWLPSDIEELVVVLDCCHAKGMKKLDLPTEATKSQRRAVIQSSLNGEFAYELKDGSNSLFVKALLEALQGRVELDDGKLRFESVMKYVIRRLPELVTSEYGSKARSQVPQVFGTVTDTWALAEPKQPWPRLPKLLTGFDTVEPIAIDPMAPKRCLVILSDAEARAPQSLREIMGDALKLAEKRVQRYGSRLDTTALVVTATDVLASEARLLEMTRALCVVPIVVFDVTNFEPGVMLLLGIRSIVRRGITICSVGNEYVLGRSLEFPFNFREVSFTAHSPAQQDPAARELMVDRLLAGIRELSDHPEYYQDLPGFDAARRPIIPIEQRAKNARPSIFVLCPFGSRYSDRSWKHLKGSLKAAFDSTLDDEEDQKYEIVRMLDTFSPRLVTQTLYEQIRRARVCVVDLTGFRANVMLELGVRMAVSPYGADCLIDAEFELDEDHRYLEAQVSNLKKLFVRGDADGASEYRVDGPIEPFTKIAQRHTTAPSTTPCFETIMRWVDTGSEVSTLRPDAELRGAARLFEPEESRAGWSAMLYPSARLQEKASKAAFERRLCAWLYLDGRYSAEEVAGDVDLREQYLSLASLILKLDDGGRSRELATVLTRVRARRQAMIERIPSPTQGTKP